MTNDIVQLVDGLVTPDRRVTVKAVTAEVGLSIGSVHTNQDGKTELVQRESPMGGP